MPNFLSKLTEFIFISSLLLPLKNFSAVGKQCPSYCTNDLAKCRKEGGRVVGYCTTKEACCDLSKKLEGTCGAFRGNDSSTVTFISPNYPDFSSHDLLCTLTYQLRSDVVGIVLDFVVFETDGFKFGPQSFTCDTDFMFIRGFESWTPPAFCGDLHGYQMVIDDSKLSVDTQNISLHGVLSSNRYRWKIKITQITEKQCKKDGEKIGNSTEKEKAGKSLSEGGSGQEPKYTRDAYGQVQRGRRSLDVQNFHANNLDLSNLNMDIWREDSDEGGIVQPLVVHGDDAPQGKVPWQASLRIDLKKIELLYGKKLNLTKLKGTHEGECDVHYEGMHKCGGAIISDQEILTAAHCFSPSAKVPLFRHQNVFKVVLGDINKCRDEDADADDAEDEEDTTTADDGDDATLPTKTKRVPKKRRNKAVQEFAVESVILHYAFDRDVILNDVAIIRLRTKIQFNENVKPIRMAEEDDDFTDQPAFASGWGRTNLRDVKNTGSDILQYSDNLQIKDPRQCKTHTLKYYQAPEMSIAALDKYKDVFQSTICIKSKNITRDVLVGEGDSGGPLVVFHANTSEPILVGVVSYGTPVVRKFTINSAGNFIDYFQSVAYYRNWIDTTLCALRNQ